MFDIGASELLLIVIVAVVVIGPKDLPLAMRTAGRWIARIRRVSNHFRSGIEAMIREAELEEMEKKWRDHNAAIMAQNPAVPAAEAAASADVPAMEPLPAPAPAPAPSAHAEAEALSHEPAPTPTGTPEHKPETPA